MRFFIVFFIPLTCLAQPKTFIESKRFADNIYFDTKTELYCGCSYKDKEVNLAAVATSLERMSKGRAV